MRGTLGREGDSRCMERTISPDGSCLWLEGQYRRHFYWVGIAWGALGGEDVLPVLD